MARVPARLRRPPAPTDQPPETGVARAIAYAEAVCDGQINACHFVHLACERFLSDLQEARGNAGLWEFRPGPAEAKILLAEMLPNIKGPLASKPLHLAGWQCFIYANVFGFYERGTDARRFRQAVVFVPKGNGKSTMAAPLALGLTFCEDEGGAEGYTAAVTRDQARIVFDVAYHMVKRSERFQQIYGVRVLANSIFQEQSASKLVPLSSDAKALDGLNVHFAVCDEIGSHKTSEVYDVLLTSMGKRLNPLLVSISTATGNTSGIGKTLWDYIVKVLLGSITDERIFGIIFTIDDGDDPWAEETWIKANPNWGISVQPDAIRGIMRQARQNPAQEAAAMTKHLNIWTGADAALFSIRAWRLLARPLKLEDFDGCECHAALDAASKVDLASIAITFAAPDAMGRLHYTTFQRSFLNEAAILEARNPSYPGWTAGGHIFSTPGNETDFAALEDFILEVCGRFKVLSFAFDPWQTTQLAQRMVAEDVPMIEFRATTQNFSAPTKELDAAMRAGRIEHDGDPVLEWAIGNVVGHYDARSNVYPRKSREENKIDPAIAVIMSIGRCLAHVEESPYSDGRGLLVLR